MDVRFKLVKFVLGAVSQEVRDKGYEKLHCAEMWYYFEHCFTVKNDGYHLHLEKDEK